MTCLSCKHKSNTVEPFWDLSLEFPERYHSIGKGSGSTAYQRSCTLTEMLSKFTEMEALEGSIYACNHCNSQYNVSYNTKHSMQVLEVDRSELIEDAHPQFSIIQMHYILKSNSALLSHAYQFWKIDFRLSGFLYNSVFHIPMQIEFHQKKKRDFECWRHQCLHKFSLKDN